MFGPGSEAWRLDREAMLLLGAGPRALLLQLAHPAVAAGVDEHSDFRADPWRRLDGTLRSYLRIIYGSTSAARGEIRRLNALHRGIRGPGYAARDPVLVAVGPRDAGRLDDRRATTPGSGRCRGSGPRASTRRRCRSRGPSACPTALLPADLDAFDAYMAERLAPGGGVHVTDTARELAEAILHPPLPGVLARLPLDPRAYGWTLWPAIGLLPPAVREALRPALGPARAARRGLARGGLAGVEPAPAGRVPADAAGARRGPPRRVSRTCGKRGRNSFERSTGVASSSVLQQRARAGQAEAVRRDVLAQRRPERRRAHPPARLVEQVAALDVDDLVVAGARVAVDRPVEQPGRAARAASRPGDLARDEVGRGLVGERLAGLVVADEAVEPLVGRLVRDEVAQVRAADRRTGSRSGPATPSRTRRPTGRP